MTEIKFEALAVLLVLLPGFISARIVDSLCTKSKQSELDTVVEALIYSFFVYVLLIASTGRLPFSVSVETKGTTSEYLFIPALLPLAMSAVIAGLLGLLSALNVKRYWESLGLRGGSRRSPCGLTPSKTLADMSRCN